MMILNTSGQECTREPRGLKLRLADVFKEPGTTASAFMGVELKALTDKDLADFKGWFIEAGYPVI